MLNLSNIINENDLVLLYENYNSIKPIYIKKNEIFNNKYGSFSHNEMINKKYGYKLKNKNKNGWLYLLKPSAELWTLSLPHRTQIIYNIDSSLICLELELHNGSIICEAGTGTGSLTSHFSECVGNLGKVYTFEFNKIRSEIAKEEFIKNGLNNIIIENRDVCENGFPNNIKCDSIFLDLPKPWIVIENSIKILKNGGKICTFSPCIEQVENNVKSFKKNGFTLIHTIEILSKPYKVSKCDLKYTKSLESYKSNNINIFKRISPYISQPEKIIKGHTSYLTFATYYVN